MDIAKKLFKILIKYFPVIQMIGMLVNNTICLFDININILYWMDFLIGNSVICTVLMMLISYIFGFCMWHRLLIITNFVNICICMADITFMFPFTGIQLLTTYYIISVIGIIAAIILHSKDEQKG